MCVTSMVSDHYFDKYSQPVQWTWQTWNEYQELMIKAGHYDIKMGQPECANDDLPMRERAVHDYLVTTGVPRVGAGYVKLQDTIFLDKK